VVVVIPYCSLFWVSDIQIKTFQFTQHTSKK